MPAEFPPIVYVEDQQVDAEALQRAFAQTRVPNELVILPDGESGRAYFDHAVKSQGQIPSLTMIDLNLGKMSGLDLIKWIREQSALKGMPIIALSAVYKYDDLEKGYDLGANLYILKPKEIRQWADLVFRLQGYWSTQTDSYGLGRG